MDHYDLAPNEGIILRHEGAYHNQKFVPANSSGKSSELLLTNLNLIFIESKIKMFKPVYTVLKFPLNQIKIVNGQVQAFNFKEAERLDFAGPYAKWSRNVPVPM